MKETNRVRKDYERDGNDEQIRMNCARFDRIKTRNKLKKRGEQKREEKRN
jgi:hypothetical protein